jgi:hypothetical protein
MKVRGEKVLDHGSINGPAENVLSLIGFLVLVIGFELN